MSEHKTMPIGDLERATVKHLLAARTRVAWTMTFIVAFLDVGFCLRMWAKTTRSGQTSSIVVIAVTTAALAGLVWYFGWGLVRRMREDLENGKKRAMTGTIRRIARARNAYGEDVTSVTLDDVELVTRAAFFAQAKEGDVMTAEFLPLSKVALRAGPAEG